MARRNRLEKLLIDRVDLVDDGANPDASILLFKRDGGDDDMADDAKDDGVQKVGAKISAARMARLKALRDELASLIADAQGDTKMEDKDKDGVDKSKDGGQIDDPVVKAKFDELTKQIDDLKAQADDAIAKAKKAEDDAKAAEAKAAQEVEKRERGDFAKRASEDLSHLPGSVDDKGNLLYTLSKKLDDAEFKAVTDMLKAADEAAKTGKITDEVGKPGKGNPGGSAFAKMKALATDKVTKGEAKSEADAIAQVAQEHPDLYTEHLADMKASAKG